MDYVETDHRTWQVGKEVDLREESLIKQVSIECLPRINVAKQCWVGEQRNTPRGPFSKLNKVWAKFICASKCKMRSDQVPSFIDLLKYLISI